jgi:hypothetical protein
MIPLKGNERERNLVREYEQYSFSIRILETYTLKT